MSKLKVVDYDKKKPTVFVDLNETLIASLGWGHELEFQKLGLSFPPGGTKIEGVYHWLRPGAEEFLQELVAKDFQLFILTRGQHPYQRKVVETFGLDKYFLQVLGRKHYDPRKLLRSTSSIPRPNYFVLVDDAALAGDVDHRSIWKLKGLGLKLPTHFEYWTEAQKELADRHFVLCQGWELNCAEDLVTDALALKQLIPSIEEKLQKQMR